MEYNGSSNKQLINFLHEQLAISAASISMALRQCDRLLGPLPMILWQYGLVSLKQLDEIFDWLES